MNTTSAVPALAALAHPVRLEAFRSLVVAGREGLAQMELAKTLGVGPTNLAFHLKELAGVGLVTAERAGSRVIYRAGYDRMDELLTFLTKNCCKGLPATDGAGAASCGC